MWFLTLVVRNLIRRPTRSVLTVAALAVAIGTVVTLLAVADNLRRSFAEVYERRGVDLVVVRSGQADRTSSLLPEQLASRIKKLTFVQSVTGGLVDIISFETAGLYAVPISGRVPNGLLLNDLKITAGRSLEEGDTKCALLGFVLARNLGKRVGDTISIYDEDFLVAGIFESFNTFENGAVFVPLRELQRLMGRDGFVTGFILILDPKCDKEVAGPQIRQSVETLQDDNGRPLRLTAMATQDHVGSALQMRIMQAVAWLVSAIALLIGAIGMLNTMMMSVFERTHEIGVLRALGWRKRRILVMILCESLALSLAGAVVGGAGGVLLLQGLSHLPWINGLLPGGVAPIVFIYGLAIAVLMGFTGGLYPAIRSASLVPTEAIRHE
ncbi:MAG: ABC transporter permease [Isosphaeraceae bacterium]